MTDNVLVEEGTSSQGTREPAKRTGQPALSGLRILVVDDDPDARDLLELLLSEAGAEVLSAASADEAFEHIQHGAPQVLVSDIGMPREDGYSLMRRIRSLPAEAGGQLPAVALTAFTADKDKGDALAAGFSLHMSKPVDVQALLAAVRSLGDQEKR